MTWFYALYSVAAVFLVIEFLWKFVALLISLITIIFPERVQVVIMLAFMCVPYYLFASYAALVSIGAHEGERSILTLSIVGVFLLFSNFLGVAQSQNEAEKQGDYVAYQMGTYKYIAILLSVGYYIYAIFNLDITINWLTESIYDVMLWIQNIPILGFIIAIIAFLYALSIMFSALVALFAMAASIVQRNQTV